MAASDDMAERAVINCSGDGGRRRAHLRVNEPLAQVGREAPIGSGGCLRRYLMEIVKFVMRRYNSSSISVLIEAARIHVYRVSCFGSTWNNSRLRNE